MSFHFTEAEREQYERDGYVVREAAFSADELEQIITDCEKLTADIVKDRNGKRWHVGSYVFEPDALTGVMVKWEGDTDAVHGLEPFAHLNKPLNDLAYDPRFIDPMVHCVSDDTPVLFTEKLNLKRPNIGGPNPMHQDHPYWREVAKDATRVATAILYLDETTLENGCLEVVPGSHTAGEHKLRSDSDPFGNLEMDQATAEAMPQVAVEVPAGSLVFFGAFLAHKTGPNTSDKNRRALLYSYMPEGHWHMRDADRMKKINAEAAAANA